jgi:hypothetical protein
MVWYLLELLNPELVLLYEILSNNQRARHPNSVEYCDYVIQGLSWQAPRSSGSIYQITCNNKRPHNPYINLPRKRLAEMTSTDQGPVYRSSTTAPVNIAVIK